MYNILSFMDNEETAGRGATRNYVFHEPQRLHHVEN
jgi:hypothetical protein